MKTIQQFYLLYLFLGLTLFVNFTGNSQAPSNKFVVVLDAGHGGKDPGKPSKYGYKEKDIALKIVLKVGALLEQNKDIKVIYTRKTDVFLELRERAAIANRADADLFVSVHCNAHNSQAYGTETFAMAVKDFDRNFEIAKKENEVIFLEDNYEKHYEGFNPNSPESMIGMTIIAEEYLDQSIMLASYVQENFTDNLKRKNRGVKQAALWVLHNTYMPSILIETGFITNKNEGDYLNSAKGQSEIAREIVRGILRYKNDVFHSFGEIVISPTEQVVDNEIAGEEALYPNVVFKVQIAASSNALEPKPYNFNGLDDISREKIGELYKYYSGYTSDYNKIKRQLEAARAKGFDTAFLVAFRDNQQIPLEEALKTTMK